MILWCGRHGDHGGGRDVRHGARPNLKRMLAFHGEPDRLMMMGLESARRWPLRGLLPLPESRILQGRPLPDCRLGAARLSTRDMNQLGGLAQRMPHTTLSWLIGVGSMMGIPLMSGFASKWMLYAAAVAAGWTGSGDCGLAVSLGTVFLGRKGYQRGLLGPLTEATKDAQRSPPTMLLEWDSGCGQCSAGRAPQLPSTTFSIPSGRTATEAVRSPGSDCPPTRAASHHRAPGAGPGIACPGRRDYAIAYVSAPGSGRGWRGAALAGGGIFTGGEPLSSQGRLTAGDSPRSFSATGIPSSAGPMWIAFILACGAGLQTCHVLGVLSPGWSGMRAVLVIVLAAAVLAVMRWLAPGAVSAAALPAPRVPLLPDCRLRRGCDCIDFWPRWPRKEPHPKRR